MVIWRFSKLLDFSRNVDRLVHARSVPQDGRPVLHRQEQVPCWTSRASQDLYLHCLDYRKLLIVAQHCSVRVRC